MCCPGRGPAYLLRSLRRWPPGGLLHLAAQCDRLLGHRAILPLLAGGGWDWGRGRGGGGRRPGPDDGHLLRGCEAQAAQAFVRLLVHHQQPGLIVQGFDPLHHLKDGIGWCDTRLWFNGLCDYIPVYEQERLVQTHQRERDAVNQLS